MKIHEYQGKQIFSRYGIAVPRGIACFSAEAAKSAAEQLIRETANPIVVVKAQIHAGGRGKAGGVKVVKGGPAEVAKVAEALGLPAWESGLLMMPTAAAAMAMKFLSSWILRRHGFRRRSRSCRCGSRC